MNFTMIFRPDRIGFDFFLKKIVHNGIFDPTRYPSLVEHREGLDGLEVALIRLPTEVVLKIQYQGSICKDTKLPYRGTFELSPGSRNGGLTHKANQV